MKPNSAKGNLFLPELTRAEVMMKQEDDALPLVNHESPKFDDDAIGTGPHHAHTYAVKTLEKGIIYFFYRSRVDVSSAGTFGVHDVARTFLVLRPNPCKETLDEQDGPYRFGDRFRLIVVPKKVLPQTPYMREMAFVEKAGITLEELQDSFIAGLNYETQTRGSRTIPDARLYARGVYSITSAQHRSYLNYFLTEPEHIGPVQTDFGLQKRGRWLVQSKNPNVSSPLSVNLPHKPRYPKSFDEIFGNYRWVELQPKLIDYPSAQFLLIGQNVGQISFDVPDVKHEFMETPDKQLEKLVQWIDEMEKAQPGYDSIYEDLGLGVGHHLKISTMWDQR